MYEKFAELLEKYGVTPYRVYKETGVPQSTLSDWKSGKSVPNTMKLKAIADYFGVTVDYFVGEKEKLATENGDEQNDEIDREIMFYAKQLSPDRKQFLLDLIKGSVQPKEY
jgi:transcriptional regulator with XRE-family HTH domain